MPVTIDILIAYPYLRSMLDEAKIAVERGHRLWLDSGAFTTYKAGSAPTPVADYIAFVKALDFPVERIFTLDVIGDPVATERNHQTLLDAGIRPVPVITPGASLSGLDAMYEHSDLVAVGGLNSNKGSGGGGPGWAKYVLEHERRPLHLLGFGNRPIIARYKPYSVDASTWEYTGRTGTMPLYMGHGRMVPIKRTDCNRPLTQEQLVALKAYGLTISDVVREQAWHGIGSITRYTGARSTVRFAMDIRRQFGTRYVFACTGRSGVRMIIRAAEQESEHEH
jgi:hypothetical protein